MSEEKAIETEIGLDGTLVVTGFDEAHAGAVVIVRQDDGGENETVPGVFVCLESASDLFVTFIPNDLLTDLVTALLIAHIESNQMVDQLQDLAANVPEGVLEEMRKARLADPEDGAA